MPTANSDGGYSIRSYNLARLALGCFQRFFYFRMAGAFSTIQPKVLEDVLQKVSKAFTVNSLASTSAGPSTSGLLSSARSEVGSEDSVSVALNHLKARIQIAEDRMRSLGPPAGSLEFPVPSSDGCCKWCKRKWRSRNPLTVHPTMSKTPFLPVARVGWANFEPRFVSVKFVSVVTVTTFQGSNPGRKHLLT